MFHSFYFHNPNLLALIKPCKLNVSPFVGLFIILIRGYNRRVPYEQGEGAINLFYRWWESNPHYLIIRMKDKKRYQRKVQKCLQISPEYWSVSPLIAGKILYIMRISASNTLGTGWNIGLPSTNQMLRFIMDTVLVITHQHGVQAYSEIVRKETQRRNLSLQHIMLSLLMQLL